MTFTPGQVEAVDAAVQVALRATNHPDLPVAGPIKFSLLILGQGEQVGTIDSQAAGVVGDCPDEH